MTNVRRRTVCLVALGMILGMAVVTAPGARASGPPTWQLAISAMRSGGDGCGGFTTLSSACSFVGATSGSAASCQLLLIGGIGIATESISGTAWDMAPGLLTPVTGVDDFFITDGTITYTGPAIVGFIATGGPQALGCTIVGKTITCSIPVLEAATLYGPDALAPVIPGHYAANVCFGTGIVDPSCSFNQQLTLVS